MYNAIFESIVRTCGADTDDNHSGEAEGNFWAENELFECVLKEAHLQESKPAYKYKTNELSRRFD